LTKEIIQIFTADYL